VSTFPRDATLNTLRTTFPHRRNRRRDTRCWNWRRGR